MNHNIISKNSIWFTNECQTMILRTIPFIWKEMHSYAYVNKMLNTVLVQYTLLIFLTELDLNIVLMSGFWQQG